MKPRDADLATLWEGVCYRFEHQGLGARPLCWRVFCAAFTRFL